MTASDPMFAHRFLKALFSRRDYDHEDHMKTLRAVKQAADENRTLRREVRRTLGSGVDIGGELDIMTEPTAVPAMKNGRHE